ncbi:MAG TPA: prolyl oligopeptidase family serine peptidase [Mycobacteriales bacterium]|nr:prolyl oligopeptidase family serine peptidase [Mycobacteriales bacterium]
MTRVPFGAWSSPISAAAVTRASRRLGGAALVAGEIWWTEGRPAESGRQAIVRDDSGTAIDVLPAPWNARSRVHEYGGSSWIAIDDAGAIAFVNFTDQRIYRLEPGGEPRPLTPEPAEPSSIRYAEPTPGRPGELLWIRESHAGGRVQRHIVAVALDGSGVREVAGGSDFLAFPRLSPDGRSLAWIAWDHPLMPWDGTELRVARLSDDGVAGEHRTLIGGPEESVLQPEWIDEETLYVISDRSGWWNLYRLGLARGDLEPMCPRDEEFAGPLWSLGTTTYAPLVSGQIAVVHGTDEEDLGILDPATGTITDLDLPYTTYGSLSTDGESLAVVAGSPKSATAVVRIDPVTGEYTEIRLAQDELPDAAYLPTPESIVVPGKDGREVHAHVFRPANPEFEGLEGELPPYVATVHGGPTAQSTTALTLGTAYFTSRGIGVISVNYGGSTGYGREYRERLRGQWGVVDVEDSVSAVEALVERGMADGNRLAITGGSAGGWTTLAALTRTDTFSAGASHFGVAELIHFVEDTHDFESRYIDGLVGPLPEARDLYIERAPLSHVDNVSCPVLLLQGSEDKIVPPSQAEMFRDALIRKGIPYAYLLFEGEQHGFRRAENQIAAMEAELSFYGQVFGFEPPEIPRLKLENT